MYEVLDVFSHCAVSVASTLNMAVAVVVAEEISFCSKNLRDSVFVVFSEIVCDAEHSWSKYSKHAD